VYPERFNSAVDFLSDFLPPGMPPAGTAGEVVGEILKKGAEYLLP